ncbi:zf-HC2 domain-containing protein [Oscillochloris sp. ZM17-4]|uniref:anti-sigma factor family protein n=1 Tax=Oscillochloris sp. ZM17-4 TaxID=2866714 RepID=UPI001C72A41D|nr:anti-sigma factor [Oscillochloris sp. ZM17-4]MBX0330715.1 zf-HC2 domain-containing protein [Oscillochloris sp. ZM17-4]
MMPKLHANLPPCYDLARQLSAYLDGELPADLCHDLEAHLGGCPDCRVVLDTLGRTVQIVHALSDTPVSLPADVEARLLSRLTGA